MEDSMKLQREAIKKLQEQIRVAEKQPIETDLTPLAAIIDEWTGSNFAKTYQAPMDKNEKMAIINKLNQQVGQAAHNLAADELDSLKAKLSQRADVRAEVEARRAKQQQLRNALEPIKMFNSDSQVKDTRKALFNIDKVNGMIDLDNPLSASFIPRALARLAGEVGVMTDKDVEAFMGSRAWTSQFNQILKQGLSGKLTSENKAIMKAAANKMAGVETGHLSDIADRYTSQFAGHYQVDPTQLKQSFVPELISQPSNVPPQSIHGPQEALQMPSFTKDEIKAEILRRRGK